MKLSKLSTIVIAISVVILSIPFSSGISAQSDYTIAKSYQIEGETSDGDVIVLDKDGNPKLGKALSDGKFLGVVELIPRIVYRKGSADSATNEAELEGTSIIQYGEVEVNTTMESGAILPGDLIGMSSIPGKAQKAGTSVKDVIGVALGAYDGAEVLGTAGPDNTEYGSVLILIQPGSAVIDPNLGSFLDRILLSVIQNVDQAEGSALVIRYILGFLIVLTSLITTFTTMGRNITKGIESIGRNPLAKVQIQTMIVLNVVLIAIINIGAVVMALAATRL